jgi:AraC-like DNA-binding protein
MAIAPSINSSNFASYNYFLPYVRYSAEDKYQNSWTLRNRQIFDNEFIFITKGTGQFTIENRTYDVKANDLILIKPNKWHSGNSIELPFNFYCVHFELYISEINNDLQNYEQVSYDLIPSKPVEYHKAVFDFPEYTSTNDSGYIQMLFRRIINETNQQQIGFNTINKAVFSELLINLFRQDNQIQGENIYSLEIHSVIDYIKQNYAAKINLSILSKHVHLQAAYLSGLFKKYTGHTITDFIKIYRISKAKDLLLKTDWKIGEVASSVGFYDLHHFSKVFKAYEGLTPVQYRQIKR